MVQKLFKKKGFGKFNTFSKTSKISGGVEIIVPIYTKYFPGKINFDKLVRSALVKIVSVRGNKEQYHMFVVNKKYAYGIIIKRLN